MNSHIKMLILAAGKGSRMKSDKPKALAQAKGKYLIFHLKDAINKIHPDKPVVVVGHQAELVKKELGDAFVYALQAEQLGTGHAVLSAKKELVGAEHVMVFYGDTVFIKSESIEKMIKAHSESHAKVTFATTVVPNFENECSGFLYFGRIMHEGDKVWNIEYKDATEEERKVKEVNVGCYIFEAKWLWENIEKIKNDNVQKEYYVNDLVKIAGSQKEKVQAVQIDYRESFAANSKEELEILEEFA